MRIVLCQVQSPGMANSDRRVLFHSGISHIGFLGTRHPLASFLSNLDVRRYDIAGASQKSMGTFSRDLRCQLVELRKYFCDHILL